MNLRHVLVCAVAAVALQACSTQQIYDGLQAGKRNACQKYNEPDRSRCLSSTDLEYDRYRREREDMLLK